ncbi:hypothetical protein DTO027B5_6453 [Paecilomyces variotii]|nr:hypothetical protein DTO021C3_6761 [Paecilomyces variotii]KAJ9322066.1 hypothetical protein DTO027B3_6918 [Paecilomyces variotii]KAJ9331777.1 hypothetical protein DTO027B5_6453 [Paecilomyces variotii]
MAYYDTIRTPRDFVEAASSQEALSFADLHQSNYWETGASHWGILQLFASRVICRQPSDILPLLADQIHSAKDDMLHPCLSALIQGPREEPDQLRRMAEIQIVRSYEPESLGYVWAALVPLLQLDGASTRTMASERPVRERNQPDRGEYVSSAGFQISSSPLDRPNTASSAPSSLGYTEKSSAPLVEDFTVRFLSCLIRCVLNYSQPLDKGSPFVQYRDERLAYVYAGVEKELEAIDDGGLKLMALGRTTQVAILEAKRSFQEISEGRPTVSNELLAQIVGEALALRLSNARHISKNDLVFIVAVKQHIKFFHLKFTKTFLRCFKTLRPADENPDIATYLQIQSTNWFDVSKQTNRKYFVRHLVALVAWADAIELHGSEDSDDSEGAGDFMDIEE